MSIGAVIAFGIAAICATVAYVQVQPTGDAGVGFGLVVIIAFGCIAGAACNGKLYITGM